MTSHTTHRRAPSRRLVATTTGTSDEAYGATEWGLFTGLAVIWGSSFLFIDIGLETLSPAVLTFLRLILGAAALATFPRARRRVDRADLPRIALLALVWMAVPMQLFPLAQQHVDSSVAGMINSAAPLTTAVVAAILLKRWPQWRQRVGLVIGFLGILAISLPSMQGAQASRHGVVLLLVAVSLYGVAFNLAVPLQQRYGSMPVLLRALLMAAVVVAPFAAAGVPASTWSWSGALAVSALGVIGTGLAFPAMSVLVGRVGGTRGSIPLYLVPVVAITLGVVVRGEPVTLLALVGTGLVLMGAWTTSRSDRPRLAEPAPEPTPGPSAGPSLEPTPEPSREPSPKPALEPAAEPVVCRAG